MNRSKSCVSQAEARGLCRLWFTMQLLSTNICVLLVTIFIQQATIDDGPSPLMTNGLLVSCCILSR